MRTFSENTTYTADIYYYNYKNLQNLSELDTNVSEHFPNMLEDC